MTPISAILGSIGDVRTAKDAKVEDRLMKQDDEGEKVLYCNKCGRILNTEHGILKEDVFEGKKAWGYFSVKDMELHSFIMCEKCYDEMIENFVIPVNKKEKTEAL